MEDHPCSTAAHLIAAVALAAHASSPRRQRSRRTNRSSSPRPPRRRIPACSTYLLPLFKAKTGIDVKVIAQGTGQALDTGRRGDADVVFVHAKSAEEKFLAEGYGVKRYPVMYNDFVLIGPKSDPAGIKGMKDVAKALQDHQGQAGDVHLARRPLRHPYRRTALWKASGIDIEKDKGPWYKAIGQGMGAALNTAGASNAYVLSDRGTWIYFKNKGDLAILVEGDKRLFNQYGVMLVNPAKHPNVKKELGQQFID